MAGCWSGASNRGRSIGVRAGPDAVCPLRHNGQGYRGINVPDPYPGPGREEARYAAPYWMTYRQALASRCCCTPQFRVFSVLPGS